MMSARDEEHHRDHRHGDTHFSDDDSSSDEEPLSQLFISVKTELLRNIRDNLALRLEIRLLKEKFFELLTKCEKSDEFHNEAMMMSSNSALERINEEDSGHDLSRVSCLTQHYNQLANSTFKARTRSLERTRNRYKTKTTDASHLSAYKGNTSGYESSSSSIPSHNDGGYALSDTGIMYNRTLSFPSEQQNITENITPLEQVKLDRLRELRQKSPREMCNKRHNELLQNGCQRLECYDLDKEYDQTIIQRSKHRQHGYYNLSNNKAPPRPPLKNPVLKQNRKQRLAEVSGKEESPPPLPPRDTGPRDTDTSTGYSSARTVTNGDKRTARCSQLNKAAITASDSRYSYMYDVNGPTRRRQNSAPSHPVHNITNGQPNKPGRPRISSVDLDKHTGQHEWGSSTDSVMSYVSGIERPPPLPPRSLKPRRPLDEDDILPPPLPPRSHVTRSSTDSTRSQSSCYGNPKYTSSLSNNFPPRHHVIRSSTDSTQSQQSQVDTESTCRAGTKNKYAPPRRPEKPAALRALMNQQKSQAKSQNSISHILPIPKMRKSSQSDDNTKLTNQRSYIPPHERIPADFDDSLSEDSVYAWNMQGESTKSDSSMFNKEDDLNIIYQMSQDVTTDQESSIDMDSMDDPVSCSQSQFFQEYHPKHRRCPDHDLHIALGEPCSYFLEERRMSSSLGSHGSAWYEDESVVSSDILSSSESCESVNSLGSVEDSVLSEETTMRPNAPSDIRSVSSAHNRNIETKSQGSYPHTDSTLQSGTDDLDDTDTQCNTDDEEPQLPDNNIGNESPTSSLAVTGSTVSDLNSVSTPNGSQSTPHQSNGSASEAPSPAFQLPLINLHDGLPRMKLKHGYSPSLSSSEAQGMMAPINSPQMTDSGGSRMSFATRSDSGSRWSYAGSRLSFSTMTDSGGSRFSYAGSRFSYLSNVTDFSAGSRYSYAVSTCAEQPDDYVELSKTEQYNQAGNRNKRIRFQTPPHMLPGEITPTHIPAHVLMEGFKQVLVYSESSESGSDKHKQTNGSNPTTEKTVLPPARSIDSDSVTDTNTTIHNNALLSQEMMREKKKSIRKKIKHFTNSFYKVNKSTGSMDIKTLGMV